MTIASSVADCTFSPRSTINAALPPALPFIKTIPVLVSKSSIPADIDTELSTILSLLCESAAFAELPIIPVIITSALSFWTILRLVLDIISSSLPSRARLLALRFCCLCAQGVRCAPATAALLAASLSASRSMTFARCVSPAKTLFRSYINCVACIVFGQLQVSACLVASICWAALPLRTSRFQSALLHSGAWL